VPPTQNPSGSAGAVVLSFLEGVMPAGLTFSRASGATDFTPTGQLETLAQNAPRFDFHPTTLQPRGLMIERPRTNLLLNAATLATQTVTVTAVAHTLSFYGTGSVTLSGAASGVLNGTGAFPSRATLTFTPTAGSLTVTVSGSVTFANLEAGGFASSFIPTTTVAATRATDLCLAPDLAALGFNPQEGTVYAEFEPLAVPVSGNFPTLWQADAGNAANRIGAYYSAGPGQRLNMIMSSGGVAQGDTSSPNSYLLGAVNKSAVAWATNDRAGCLNGGTVMTDLTAIIPTGLTTFRCGTGATGAEPLNGWLRRLIYTPARLPNAQLQALTA
jgi:hypothetical protein